MQKSISKWFTRYQTFKQKSTPEQKKEATSHTVSPKLDYRWLEPWSDDSQMVWSESGMHNMKAWSHLMSVVQAGGGDVMAWRIFSWNKTFTI